MIASPQPSCHKPLKSLNSFSVGLLAPDKDCNCIPSESNCGRQAPSAESVLGAGGRLEQDWADTPTVETETVRARRSNEVGFTVVIRQT